MEVVDPEGASWRVERIWTPWPVRRRVGFVPDDLAFGVGTWIAGWLLLVAEGAVAYSLGAAARMLDRPWTVVATRDAAPRQQLKWKVRGYRASLDRVVAVAERIAAGETDLWQRADARRIL